MVAKVKRETPVQAARRAEQAQWVPVTVTIAFADRPLVVEALFDAIRQHEADAAGLRKGPGRARRQDFADRLRRYMDQITL